MLRATGKVRLSNFPAPVGRLGVIALAMMAGAWLPTVSARADEDAKKLADRKPAFFGPVVKGLDAKRRAGPVSRGVDSFAARNVELLSWIPLNNFPGGSTSAADLWGYTSPSGREYAIVGLENGTAFVEVTDPRTPRQVAYVPGPSSLWKDVAVIGPWAYTVSEGGAGIQVHDLREIDAGRVTKIQDKIQGGHTTSHTIVYNPDSGWLYLCGTNVNNGGLTPVSTADPSNPTFGPTAWRVRYVHEAQVVTFKAGPFAGREIAFLFTGGPAVGYADGGGLDIVDVSDKANLVTLTSSAVPPVPFRYPGLAFCHQGWIDDTERFLYINDEIDGPGQGVPYGLTRILDISDLRRPQLAGTATSSVPGAIDHNLYWKGRHLYASNYTSGLRIFDATDRTRPVEVGFIDTRPEDDRPTYNGSWGNYPYFASGTILISDLERGLFVVRAQLGQIIFSFPTPLPTALAPGRAADIMVNFSERDVRFVAGSAKFFWSVNGGAYTSALMTQTGPGALRATLPGLTCFDRVQYYFTADGDDGRTFTSPPEAPTAGTYSAIVQTGTATAFSDDFETDRGWTVASIALTSGAWIRDDPIGTTTGGQQANPEDDFTPAPGVRCWFTGQGVRGGLASASDVDGGPTRLTSPVINLSGRVAAELSVARWFFNDDGDDVLDIEVSSDNGVTWRLLERLGNTGGWKVVSYALQAGGPLTANMRLRFSTADNPNNSITEVAVDDVTITVPLCDPPPPVCYADCNKDGSLNIQDFTCFQNQFALGEAYADCDGNGVQDVRDFTCFQNRFALGCP